MYRLYEKASNLKKVHCILPNADNIPERMKGAVKLSTILNKRQYADKSVLRRLRIWQST